MIARFEKSGIHIELDNDLARYIDRKIGRLDKYIPRTARKPAHATVSIRKTGSQTGNKYQCEVVLQVPGETIVAKESALNKFAAVDIVEANLKNQLHKYRSLHSLQGRRGILRRARQRLSGLSRRATSND